MINLGNEIKNLPDPEFPAGLHGRIMRRLFLLKFKRVIIAVFSVLGTNLLISTWQIWARTDREIVTAFKVLFEGFELNADFADDFFRVLAGYLPLRAFAIFAVNLIVLAYISYIFLTFKKHTTKVGLN